MGCVGPPPPTRRRGGPGSAGHGRAAGDQAGGAGRPVARPGVIVAVGVIAVGRVLAPDAVDDHAEDRDPGHGELAVGPLDQRQPAGVEPGGHHRPVGPPAHDQGVGHRQDRRGVDDHQVVGLAEPAEQLAEPGRLQDPAGVAARGPGREEVEPAGLDRDRRLVEVDLAGQDVAQAGADRHVEQPAQRGPPHVGVDQQGRGPGVGAAGGQVGRQGRLPLAAGGAGDHHAPPLARHPPLAERHPEVVQALDEPGQPLLGLVVVGVVARAGCWAAGRSRRPRGGPATERTSGSATRADRISSRTISPRTVPRTPTGVIARYFIRLSEIGRPGGIAALTRPDPGLALGLELELLEPAVDRLLHRLEALALLADQGDVDLVGRLPPVLDLELVELALQGGLP